jgi:flavin-dependent trigonelline monooxygenase, reductase component
MGEFRGVRRALGALATGITVITTRWRGDRVGFTANSFTSVSLEPPLLLFCVGRSRKSYQAFREADSFAINVLSSPQRGLSELFASSGTDKWRDVDHDEDEFSNPILSGSAAVFSCLKRQVVDAADHMIVVGGVNSYRENVDALPLVYCRSRYCLPIEVASAPVAAV